MLDIKFIKANADLVKENVKKRFTSADVDLVISLYNEKISLQADIDSLRQARNENAKKMKQKLSDSERNSLIEAGKKLKDKIALQEEKLKSISENFTIEHLKIPNLTDPSTPIGPSEKDSYEIKKVGTIPQFDFDIKDHMYLANNLDIIDFDAGSKVSGQKFYYLKKDGALLELALIQYAMTKLVSKGFTPYLTPDLARTSVVEGIGFNPRGKETNIYSVDGSDLCLVGTAEITLGGMYQKTTFKPEDLPIKMVGFSHCFRTEAGAAGLATKGLYRVHQFSKVEMFVITTPDKSSEILEELRSIEEEIVQELGIPYRLLNIASGDLGAPAYKKYDLEAWMPGRKDYGEITSTSNCTDYQSRRLNIKYKDAEGKNKFVHMVNGTAIAVPRIIIAILENFQQQDGSVHIPQALTPYMGKSVIKLVNETT